MTTAPAKPVTLVYFTDSFAPSGVGRHLALLLAGLDRSRFRPLVVCPETEGSQRLFEQLREYDVPYSTLCVRSERGDDYPRLIKLLRDEQATIFHAQNGVSWEGHYGILAAHEAGVPIILATEHLPFVLDKAGEIALKTEINTYIDRMIAVSCGVRDSHLASGTIAPNQMVAIPNGIDLSRFDAIAPEDATTVRAALGIDRAAPLIGTIARLEEQKGHYFLLQAARQVLEQFPDARFVMVGDGSLRDRLQNELTPELGLQESVIWIRERNDIPALMAACDMIVLPSLFEGLPLTALEAMAAGRPFVGTTCCGTAETVIDERTGLLVPPCDEHALAQAIIRILSNPSWASELGSNARKHVERHFNVPLMISRYHRLYADMLGQIPNERLEPRDRMTIKTISENTLPNPYFHTTSSICNIHNGRFERKTR